MKYESLGQITRCSLDGYKIGVPGKGPSLNRGQGQDGHSHEVLQGIATQICIKCIETMIL